MYLHTYTDTVQSYTFTHTHILCLGTAVAYYAEHILVICIRYMYLVWDSMSILYTHVLAEGVHKQSFARHANFQTSSNLSSNFQSVLNNCLTEIWGIGSLFSFQALKVLLVEHKLYWKVDNVLFGEILRGFAIIEPNHSLIKERMLWVQHMGSSQSQEHAFTVRTLNPQAFIVIALSSYW